LPGDIAAGKEQTFARSLALVGGKLHYRDPDFLDATFMDICGSVSKAQKFCTSTRTSMPV
jgi:hypothetical protein